MTPRARTLSLALGTGIAAAALHLVILRNGIWFTPDSWAYWEGSVSILRGEGYQWFHGSPVQRWPPLFSCYLAAWQWLLGVSGETLRVAMVVSTGVGATIWVVFLSATMRPGRVTAWCCVFLIAMFAQVTRHLMAESLTMIFLPVLLLLSVHASEASTRPRFMTLSLLAALVCAMLLLTKLVCASFACAVVVSSVLNRSMGRGTRVAACALFAIVALAPALIAKFTLATEWIYPVGVGVAKHGPVEYLFQIARGFGDRFAPAPLGVVVWLFVAAVGVSRLTPDPGRARVRICVAFCVLTTIVMYAMFNLTWIFAELKGRFLYFVPLLTGATILMVVHTIANTRLRAVLIVLIVALPVGKTIKYVIKGRAPATTMSDEKALESHFIRARFTIDPSYTASPPRLRDDGKLLVSTPGADWVETQMRAK